MSENKQVLLPSKPRIVSEEGFSGTYEIDGLYPGYGHTLGNSLRRIILLSPLLFLLYFRFLLSILFLR